jgi:hypothetical protein
MCIQALAIGKILEANRTLFAIEICRGDDSMAAGGRDRVCERGNGVVFGEVVEGRGQRAEAD